MDENSETYNSTKTRLTKSRDDRVIDGVCGGLAEYFGIDTVIVRLAFIVFTLINGFGILLYIIFMVIMPKPEDDENTPISKTIEQNVQGMAEQVKDIVEDVTKDLDKNTSDTTATRQQKIRQSHQRSGWFGAILILLGIVFLFDELNLFWWFNEKFFWPLILILIGLWMLIKRGGR
ncbi:MAG: PspC domain-containing protein [Methanosarcinaceae archaeon]|nr:PspC domain-containing protein [Methanosarcinaceae archaeon]